MYLVVVGLNYKTAPVEVREKLSFSEDALQESLTKLKGYKNLEGCALLSTCNRTEVYAATLDVESGLNSIRNFLSECSGVEACEIKNYLYTHTLYDCIHHLFRVAAGLDSMVLGETQILGQVRVAYQKSCEYGATNGILNTLFQQAITVGKRVRTETGIDRHAVSISYAAVELAKQVFGTLDGNKILIIGAGKMSELTAKHLLSNGVADVVVANRSFDKAVVLAEQFGGRAIKYEQLFEHMVDSDIVISCTSAENYILDLDNLTPVLEQRENKKIFMIDIAVPRDIDPVVGGLDNVELYDIDELQYVVDKNLEQRRKAAAWAEQIIDEEINEFFKWLNSQFIIPTIVALKKKGEIIKEEELTRALNRMGNVTEREKKIIGSLANSLVNQLLHDPIMQLKAYALTTQGHLYTEILQNLFCLDVAGQRKKKSTSMEEEIAEIASHHQ